MGLQKRGVLGGAVFTVMVRVSYLLLFRRELPAVHLLLRSGQPRPPCDPAL